MTLRIFCLPPETIAPLWPSLLAKLNPVIERSRGLITEPHTFERLHSGAWIAWVAYDGNDLKAAVVTRITKVPSGQRILEAIMAGGEDRRLWQKPIVERLKQYMLDEECSAFRIVGRKGWERVYPDFKVEQIVLEYRL